MFRSGRIILGSVLKNKSSVEFGLSAARYVRPTAAFARYSTNEEAQRLKEEAELRLKLKEQLDMRKLEQLAAEKAKKLKQQQLEREKRRREKEKEKEKLAQLREAERQAQLRIKRKQEEEMEKLRKKKQQLKLKEWKDRQKQLYREKMKKAKQRLETPKRKKDPNAPVRARTAFVFYYKDNYPIISNEFKQNALEEAKKKEGDAFSEDKFLKEYKTRVSDIMREAMKRFNALKTENPEEYRKYEFLAEQDKIRYEADRKQYMKTIEARKAKKPLTPYIRFFKEKYETVRKEAGEGVKVPEIAKKIATMWRELPEDQKQPYIEAYEADKQRLEEARRIDTYNEEEDEYNDEEDEYSD